MLVVNEEIKTYQTISPLTSLQKVWELAKATPHEGQQAVIDVFDHNPNVNCYVGVNGRRVGKSFSTSFIVLRELLIPFSNTILLSPSYKNSKIMFDEVLKHVAKLGLEVKSKNAGQFTLELTNGAKFTSVTKTNVESALGSRLSLLVVDETQSIENLADILEQLLMPMLLDYGVKENGILHARMVFIGTPRGVGTYFHELYLKELTQSNWKSFSTPSTVNPLLPRAYIEEQKNILPDHIYRMEILAEWLSTGVGVFHQFNLDTNTYDPEAITFDTLNKFIIGLDYGARDSTAAVLVYIDNQKNYYIHDYYMASMKTTQAHVESFRSLESRNPGHCEERFSDPAALQTITDLRDTYDYDTIRANNKIAEGIACLNDLMAPQGLNKKPKLFINKQLVELIAQIQLITYKTDTSTRTSDPFVKHKDHHFDLVHAMRYAIYSYFKQDLAGEVIVC